MRFQPGEQVIKICANGSVLYGVYRGSVELANETIHICELDKSGKWFVIKDNDLKVWKVHHPLAISSW